MIKTSEAPTIIILAGPNGAGKSTLFKYKFESLVIPFINADVIQDKELRDERLETSYLAAQIASARRSEHLQNRKSFVTESVFSHSSKLELIDEARKAGFTILVCHIGLGSADLSVRRVSQRVMEGGHGVPEEKIRGRYNRNGLLIRKAILQADKGLVFDNSVEDQPPKSILKFEHGRLARSVSDIPLWVEKIYSREINDFNYC